MTTHVRELLGQIPDAGFDALKATGGVAVEIRDHMCNVIDFNNQMVKGAPLLAPVLETDGTPLDAPFLTLLRCDHLCAILRAFLCRAYTTGEDMKKGIADEEGRLSLDKLRDKESQLAEHCERGLEVTILDKAILGDPDAVRVTQASHNVDLAMPEDEVQLLLDARQLIAQQRMDTVVASDRL